MPVETKSDRAFVTQLRQARDLLDGVIQQLETGSPQKPQSRDKAEKPSVGEIDFSTPLRPFIKKHSAGKSGAQKFALLVAYLTKGDQKRTVSLAEVEKEWSRMTELLGGKFNGAHSGRARDNDLVATEKAGLYRLRPNWKAIFE